MGMVGENLEHSNDKTDEINVWQTQAEDLEREMSPEAERQFYSDLGEKIIQSAEVDDSDDAAEVFGEDATSVNIAESENSFRNLPEPTLEEAWPQQFEPEHSRKAESAYDTAEDKGLLSGVKQKLKSAVGVLTRKPRGAVAALIAASAISSFAGGSEASAASLNQDKYTAIETQVDAVKYQGKKTDTKTEKAEKTKGGREVYRIDNGDTVDEVVAAMDDLPYRVYAEFNKKGKKVYEATEYRNLNVPRPDKLGSLKGRTTVVNHPHTNKGFNKNDFLDAAANKVGKSIIVTDDYVFTLEAPDNKWPSRNKINHASAEAKGEARAARQAVKEADPEHVMISADLGNETAALMAEKLGLTLITVNKEDQTGAAKLDDTREYFSRDTGEFSFTNHGDNIYDWMKNAHAEPYEVRAIFTLDQGRTKLLDCTSYSAGTVSTGAASPEEKQQIRQNLLQAADAPRIDLHTHPTSSHAFSQADLKVFLGSRNAAEIVVTRDKVFMIDRGETNEQTYSKAEIEQMINTYEQDIAAHKKEARQALRNGGIVTPEMKFNYALVKSCEDFANRHGFNFHEYSINALIPDKNGDIDPTLARDIEMMFYNHQGEQN